MTINTFGAMPKPSQMLKSGASTITGTVSALAGGTRKVRRKSSHIPGDLFCQADLPVDLGGQVPHVQLA